MGAATNQSTARIAIAGLGLVSPLGDAPEAAWARLVAGESAIGRMSFEGLPDIPAAAVTLDVAQGLNKLQQVGTERVSQMALAAARRAIADAGLGPWHDPERVGLYLGTGMGGAATIDAGYAALCRGTRVPPLTVPAGMVNSAAGIVAMHTDIRGPSSTYAAACSSSAVAFTEAVHALRRGEIDIALVGGAEALLVRGTVAAWQALRALATPAERVERSCRPFSADRNGLVLGEGAAFMVLRRGSDLEQDGKAPRAWFAGGAVRTDASHQTQPQVRGQVAALKAALDNAGLTPAQVGYCNAHGTATIAGDPVECESLRQLWGDAAPSLHVSSTKAAHGHLLGAAGALEAAWTVLALQHGVVPPTSGVSTLDPACAGLGHVLGVGQAVHGLRHAISNSFAFGGTNVALVFSRA